MRPCLAGMAGLIALAIPASAQTTPDTAARQAVARALTDWTEAFNARDAAAVCAIFAPDLRFDVRGFPERGYRAQCDLLRAILADRSKRYQYALTIKEVLAAGNLAVARVVWRLTVNRAGQESPLMATVEPGLDVFRHEPDGSWRIIRYLAFTAPP